MTVRLSMANDGTAEAEAVSAYLAATMPNGETVRFSERGVVLTEHHVRLNFAIYPLQDIKAVRLWKHQFNYGMIFVVLGFGIISAAITAYSFLFGQALVFFLGSLLLALLLRIAIPSTYVLRLTLPGGEHDVLMARDRRYLLRVAAALNEKHSAPIKDSESGNVQLLESARSMAQALLKEEWTAEMLLSLEAQGQELTRAMEQKQVQGRARGRMRLLMLTLNQAYVAEQGRVGEQIQARGLERARALLEVRRVVESLVE